MFDVNAANKLLADRKEKIEEQKKLIASYLETLSSSTLGLQVDKGTVDTLVAMSVMSENISFKDKVISEVGCTDRDFYQSLKKFTLRVGLEQASQNLKATERALLVETACKDDVTNYNLLVDIIKSSLNLDS